MVEIVNVMKEEKNSPGDVIRLSAGIDIISRQNSRRQDP
jgi:hypothetical protein